jgi:hypothetical protein
MQNGLRTMKASDWISVKDRLPELHCDAGFIKFSGEVLLCVGNGEVLTARLVCDKSDNTMFWSASRGGSLYLEESTNWQEIVLPKKEES